MKRSKQHFQKCVNKKNGRGYRSISAHSLLSAYFLAVYSYKRMRLTTRVYGIAENAHAQSMIRKRSSEQYVHF